MAMDKVDLELPDMEIVSFEMHKDCLSVNKHKIENGDMPWLCGYDFTWAEVYKMLKDYLEK